MFHDAIFMVSQLELFFALKLLKIKQKLNVIINFLWSLNLFKLIIVNIV